MKPKVVQSHHGCLSFGDFSKLFATELNTKIVLRNKKKHIVKHPCRVDCVVKCIMLYGMLEQINNFDEYFEHAKRCYCCKTSILKINLLVASEIIRVNRTKECQQMAKHVFLWWLLYSCWIHYLLVRHGNTINHREGRWAFIKTFLMSLVWWPTH